MSFTQGQMQQMPTADPYDTQTQQGFELTPEEIKILQECSKEGVYSRAIPTGIIFGLTGFLGAKAGILMHKKFGPKPAVIGLGILGYFIGRFSYSGICIERCMKQVPNGTINRYHRRHQKTGEYVEPPSSYTSELHKTQDSSDLVDQRSSSDISDLPTMSSFDTIPSEYYKENAEEAKQEVPPQSYTSYDDLRKKNRQEYTNRLYPNAQSTYSGLPQDSPVVRRRPTPQESYQPDIPAGPKTKYGDSWDT